MVVIKCITRMSLIGKTTIPCNTHLLCPNAFFGVTLARSDHYFKISFEMIIRFGIGTFVVVVVMYSLSLFGSWSIGN